MTKPNGGRPTFTAHDLEGRLAKRYRSPEAEILFDVRNDAGFSATRSCDALAMGLWPSTGCALQGFEIKVSRSDWLRELKDGGKSEAFMPFVDFWWLVAPREIVTDDELPPTWGLLAPSSGDTLKVLRPATRRANPLPIPRGMLAAMVKRSSTAVARQYAIDAAYQRGVEEGKRRGAVATPGAPLLADYDRLREQVAAFEKATGVNVAFANSSRMAELHAADALLRLRGYHGSADTLNRAAMEAEVVAAHLRRAAIVVRDAAAPVASPLAGDPPVLHAEGATF